MKSERRDLERREWLRIASAAVASTGLAPTLGAAGDSEHSSRVVRVHDSEATKPWNYSANAPWDHTVEMTTEMPGKITERYYDYINDDVVTEMLGRGLRELTGAATVLDSWKTLLPGVSAGQRVTLKINANNASYNEAVTTNRMDQTMPLVNAVLTDLIEGLGVAEENVILLDARRWFHPRILKARCRYSGVKWVDSKTPDRWDTTESVTFSRDQPPPGGNFWMPRAYTEADHIINLCLMKNHGCGITGAMKSHFGSIPSPKHLHKGLGDKSYIADLCATPSIRNKVRVNIVDALFANWHNNVWSPRPWKTFPEPSPNSLLLSRDPVALDSVMLDHIVEEIEAQGENAPEWVRDAVTHHSFLEHAMTYHQLGVFERKPYSRIDYRNIEA